MKSLIVIIGIKVESSLRENLIDRLSATKHMGKLHIYWLLENEEQMLFLREVPDNIFVISTVWDFEQNLNDWHLQWTFAPQNASPINDDEGWVRKKSSYENGSFKHSRSSFLALLPTWEECVYELDSSEKEMAQILTNLTENVRATFNIVTSKVEILEVKVNLIMGVVVLEHKTFFEVRDAKALKKIMLNLE